MAPWVQRCLDENEIVELLLGRVSDAERADIDTHLDGCSACRELLAAVASMRVVGEARPEQPVDADRAGESAEVSREAASTEPARASDAPLAAGTRLGRYLVASPIGRGGMGVVYAAYDPELDRKIALKLLHIGTSDEGAHKRLLREAKAMAQLSHPNVVTVHDVGTLPTGGDFVAMELVEGVTLRRWLSERRRSWRDVLRVFLEAGRGLAAAHAAGIVHRDFKPDNVLVSPNGRVQVTDFGLARPVAEIAQPPPAGGASTQTVTEALTRTGALVGTPAYMAPEQLEGGEIDPRTDQFGFAVALHEGLFGVRPFGGTDVESMARAARSRQLAALPDRGRAPARLRRALLKALEADPDKRYPNMGALIAALEAARVEAGRWRFAVGALIAAGLIGATGWGIARERRGASGAPEMAATCPGVCAPGETDACGMCGRRTCGPDCTWGACAGEGVCVPGSTRPCDNGCVPQVCSSACTWCDCSVERCADCDGTPGGWLGCRGNGCAVCVELLAEYPCYLDNHPECGVNFSCAAKYYACNAKCPAPTEADACACTPNPDGWRGCRGTGCSVCTERIADYACYLVHHPGCKPDISCNGDYGACTDSICPPPSPVDRGSRE